MPNSLAPLAAPPTTALPPKPPIAVVPNTVKAAVKGLFVKGKAGLLTNWGRCNY
jgi:hypothetical protein